MLESAFKSVAKSPWLLLFTGLSWLPVLPFPSLSHPPSSFACIVSQLVLEMWRAYLSPYFQDLLGKFLAIVLLALTGLQMQKNKTVGFPHLFPFEFVTFSCRIKGFHHCPFPPAHNFQFQIESISFGYKYQTNLSVLLSALCCENCSSLQLIGGTEQ